MTKIHLGTERVFKKFLLLPRSLPVGHENGPVERRWLCWAYIRCEYMWDADLFGKYARYEEKYFVE